MFPSVDVRALARRHKTALTVGAVTVLLIVALTALHRLTGQVRLAEVAAAFRAIPPVRLVWAGVFTAASYLALTFYDVVALGIIGRPLPWRTAAIASFTSYTLSHNLGLSLLTGGSARFRVYTAAGLDGPDVARVIGLASATFWAGVIAFAGAALLVQPDTLLLTGHPLTAGVARGIGGVVAVTLAGLLLLCARGPRRVRLFGWTMPLPRARQAATLLGVAMVDLAAASAALLVLAPAFAPALLPTFMVAYSLAIIVALLTHVPGGLGVFEAVVLATVPGDRTTLLAALLAYRVIYYLLPLALGIVLLALREGRAPGGAIAGARQVAIGLAPLVMSAASFAGGALLLLSGSLPAIPARLRDLHAVVPLPFIEASHLAASLAGTGLLLLAPALYRRLDGAFVAARALLLAGAAFSLFKGIDYEEATVCLVIAGLLQWTRTAFYRRTELVARPLSAPWLASMAAVLGFATWIGFFSFKHVDYRASLWWDFALNGDASRFLRATLSVLVLLVIAAWWRLIAPARVAAPPSPGLHAVKQALEAADHSEAMLALTGDKRFLFSPDGAAFVMYQVRGSSWIVMADPVGPRDAWSDLLWRIRDMADAAQGRLLLYQISPDALELAIELGLHIVKYGESAHVDLASFSLDGPRMRALRHAERRVTRAGGTFEIMPADEVPAAIPALAAISGSWLAAKGQREKAFSLGRFDASYLAQFPCALVRQEGRPVAFANIVGTANRRELSVDLMRHGEGAMPGVMDFLFIRLMLWGREQGFERFSLGVAPLSGIEARRLAPTWARLAGAVFRHGERLYGFRGLRAYKEKFAPVWQPRYIAGPAGIGLLSALRDVGALVSNRG